jgi:hypothetical protein
MGAQLSLPWSSALDLSYVGQRATDRLQRFDLNSVDFGAGFLPENQNPTLAPTVDGTNANVTALLRPYRGIGLINQNTGISWRTFHSIQASFNRRYLANLAFGVNYTYTISDRQNIAPRLEHFVDGSGLINYRNRSDQDRAQELLGDAGAIKHIVRANAVWDLPDYRRTGGFNRILSLLASDWQVSGILAAQSGTPYDLSYQYDISDAESRNRIVTGSPNFGGRIVLLPNANLGSGCSDNQFAQFNNSVSSVGGGLVSNIVRAPTGPSTLPAAFASHYGLQSDGPSVGLESGNNYLTGCPSTILDLSLVRNIRVGGGRSLQFRVDAFNVLNTVVFTGRQSTLFLNSPTNPTIRTNTSTFIPDPNSPGSFTRDTSRDRPQDAGFGAVTSAAALRTIQAQLRFQF